MTRVSDFRSAHSRFEASMSRANRGPGGVPLGFQSLADDGRVDARSPTASPVPLVRRAITIICREVSVLPGIGDHRIGRG